MIRVGGNGLAPDGATQEGEPGWGTGRLSRAGLFSRSAAILGALGGIAVGATELAAASDSQRTPAHDREIFGLALLIARLQAAFYADALAAGHLTGEAHQFASVVGGQEKAHVSYLTSALGSSAGKSPSFHFGDATTDPTKFIATAATLESTSLAVYNGQGVNLTPTGLAAAARIVSVEARHAAWARALAGEIPAPVAVDVPMTVNQAKAVFRPFIA
jgi:hypothetical protein